MEHLASAVALAMRVEAQGKHETNDAAKQRVSSGEAERIVEEWPNAPKTTALMMMERFGAPNEATPGRLIWHQAGQWKRVTVTRDVYTHHFPMPHSDFLSLTIDYHVPLDKVADALRLDGSIIIDRTAGEVTARCDSEAADILTLNLLHDVVTGARGVEEARRFFAESAPKFNMGQSVPAMERLQFSPPATDTEFLDEAMVGEALVEQVKEKAKSLL